MLNWKELIGQMRSVGNELQLENGDVKELGDLINDWADQIENENERSTAIAKAVQAARAFHPVTTNA